MTDTAREALRKRVNTASVVAFTTTAQHAVIPYSIHSLSGELVSRYWSWDCYECTGEISRRSVSKYTNVTELLDKMLEVAPADEWEHNGK